CCNSILIANSCWNFRQKQAMIQLMKSQTQTVEEITIDSDDEETDPQSHIKEARQELIDLLDSDEETGELRPKEQTDSHFDDSDISDQNNCGLFTDDRLNLPDE